MTDYYMAFKFPDLMIKVDVEGLQDAISTCKPKIHER